MSYCFLYIPTPSKAEARLLARILLEEKLIACANLIPIESMYVWEGQVQEEAEVTLICKTLDELATKVQARVLEIHSYDVPCVAKIATGVNESFGEWIQNEVQ